MATNYKDKRTEEKEAKEAKEAKKMQELNGVKSNMSGLVKFLVVLTFLLIIVVGYLTYMLITSPEAMAQSELILDSIFNNEDEELLHPLDEFKIKLADKKYTAISMSIGYTGKEEALEPINSILRDKVIFELMALSSKDLEVNNIEITKKLLVEELNALTNKAEIKNIYIDNIVVQ